MKPSINNTYILLSRIFQVTQNASLLDKKVHTTVCQGAGSVTQHFEGFFVWLISYDVIVSSSVIN